MIVDQAGSTISVCFRACSHLNKCEHGWEQLGNSLYMALGLLRSKPSVIISSLAEHFFHPECFRRSISTLHLQETSVLQRRRTQPASGVPLARPGVGGPDPNSRYLTEIAFVENLDASLMPSLMPAVCFSGAESPWTITVTTHLNSQALPIHSGG